MKTILFILLIIFIMKRKKCQESFSLAALDDCGTVCLEENPANLLKCTFSCNKCATKVCTGSSDDKKTLACMENCMYCKSECPPYHLKGGNCHYVCERDSKKLLKEPEKECASGKVLVVDSKGNDKCVEESSLISFR